MKEKKSKILDRETLKYLGKVALITLLIVFVLRGFFFELYTISTSQMESALIKGDEVLVSKLSYGPRLPITALTIPFTHDRFWGVKSYSDLIQFPYMRLFGSDILRNDVVLFNSPLEREKPVDKRELLISRCVGIPGDTIKIEDGIYYINDEQYVQSPTLLNEYVAPAASSDGIIKLVNELRLDVRQYHLSGDSLFFTLNRYDAFILSKYTSPDTFYRKEKVMPETLRFIVPSKGRGVILSPNIAKTYRQIIEYEQGEKAVFQDDEVFIDNQKIDRYYFSDDYYWMLSDNTVDAKDSRELGFIPFRNVVGRVAMVLYSKGETGLRADRFLMPVQ